MVPSSASDVSPLYPELLKTMDKVELEEEINKKISSFNGLLTRDIALKMIAREKGIYKSDLTGSGSRDSVINAALCRILPEENYRTGKRSRAMEIKDSDGKIRTLRLWNDDVILFAKLRVGDEITISGAYEKNGILNLGYSGKVSISKSASFANIADLKPLPENSSVSISGEVISLNPGVFEVSDGVSSVSVFGNTQTTQIIAVGDKVILENALTESGNLCFSDNSRLLVKKPKATGAGMSAMGRKEILESMGLKVADDITLETIVNLKKSSLSNANQGNPVLCGASHV
ncbi:MAG: hypothetical protein AABW86_00595 [Candidatus Micrarchaeota archaeon]